MLTRLFAQPRKNPRVETFRRNKEIAALLDKSVRTIEAHRANMMQKLWVDTLIDLLKRAVALGLIDLSANGEP